MIYSVELTARASRDLRQIYSTISAADSQQARVWLNGLEAAVLSLREHPARSPIIPEDGRLRHLLYANKRHVYRIIFALDEAAQVVTVLHIQHGSCEPLS